MCTLQSIIGVHVFAHHMALKCYMEIKMMQEGYNLLMSTSVDPVNDTLLISMCSDIAAPAVGP